MLAHLKTRAELNRSKQVRAANKGRPHLKKSLKSHLDGISALSNCVTGSRVLSNQILPDYRQSCLIHWYEDKCSQSWGETEALFSPNGFNIQGESGSHKRFQVRQLSFGNQSVTVFPQKLVRKGEVGSQEARKRWGGEEHPALGEGVALVARWYMEMKWRRRNNVVLHPTLPTTICENWENMIEETDKRKEAKKRLYSKMGEQVQKEDSWICPAPVRKNIPINLWRHHVAQEMVSIMSNN